MTTELLFPLQHFSFFRIKERNYDGIVPNIFSNDLQISNRWTDDKTLTSGEPWCPAKRHVLQCRACLDIKVYSGFIIQDSHALSFDTIPLFNY